MLLSLCSHSASLTVFLILKTIFKVICIVLPLIIIIRVDIPLFQAVIDGGKKIKEEIGPMFKSLFAALIVFLLPTLFSYVFTDLVDPGSAEIFTCFDTANTERIKVLREQERQKMLEEKKKRDEELKRETDKKTKEWEEETERKHKEIEKQKEAERKAGVHIANGEMFSKQTADIIEAHMNDFNYNNFRSVINSYGGFENYVRNLGGIFSKYYGSNVSGLTCASQLQEVSEYVFGFMYMYGFDYYNGSKYCKWGGSCGNPATKYSDAFYPSGMQHTSEGLSDKNHFDKIVSGADEINMTTNCNWTVDMVYYKAGLFGGKGQPGSSASFKSLGKNYQVIPNMSSLQVGDIVHFFRKPVDRSNPDTWGEWFHVAYVGEVDHVKGEITFYDGGSFMTNNRNYKWKAKIDDSESSKLHGSSWSAVRITNIDQNC